jgi:hypothetical protein
MSYNFQDYNLAPWESPHWYEEDREYRQRRQNEKERKKYTLKVKLLSQKVKTAEEFRQLLLKIVLDDRLKSMALRYCEFEKLPSDYSDVALQKNVLVGVIDQHIKKLGIVLSQIEIDELTMLVIQLYNNEENKNIYSRVTDIQSFVHSKAKIYLGDGGELKLNTEMMRKLLSISRLHLNIADIKKGNISLIINELKINKQQRESKQESFPNYLYKAEKRYIKNWKVRHLRSIFYFAMPEERELIQNLLKVKDSVSIDGLIELLANNWSMYDRL